MVSCLHIEVNKRVLELLGAAAVSVALNKERDRSSEADGECARH